MIMNDKYLVWTAKVEPKACRVLGMEGFDEGYRLRNGERLAGVFPDHVTFRMNPDFPNDRLLVDNVMNVDRAILASPRLAELVQSHSVDHVEYLPVRIIDHKNKIASDKYVMIHPIDA